MARCSRLVFLFTPRKSSVLCTRRQVTCEMFISKAFHRPCGKNNICGYIWHKLFIQSVKCSFFSHIIVYQSFYGALLKLGETGRRLADRFRKHLRDAEQNNTDASKPVVRHFNLPNHSHHNITICGLSLHHRNTESRKNLEQKFIFQLGTLSPHGINERLSFH